MSTSTTTEHKLEVRRFIAASPERIFKAWTDPEEAMQWFRGETCQGAKIKADLRVGGRYSMDVTVENGEVWTVSGEYREIEPPRRLVYTWQWEDDADWEGVTSVITVEFNPKPGGTEIHLTHEGFPTDESRGNHESGWGQCITRLEKMVTA